MSDTAKTAIAILAVVLALSATITGESLFTDEGYSAWLASHPSAGAMWQSLYDGDSSELQMLLYNLYLWTWVRVFGNTEYAMRLANVPFIALFVISLAATSRLVFCRRWAWMVVALSPFVAIFINQCRAYTALMACAAASTGALLVYIAVSRYRRLAAWLCLGFLIAGIWFHVMSGLLVPALAVIAAVYSRGERDRWWRDWRSPLTAAVPVWLATGAYLAWTFAHAPKYHYEPPHPLESAYTLYKFFGFWSFGPSNSSVAGAGEWAPVIRYGIPVAVGVAALGIALFHRVSRRTTMLLAAFGCSFAIFIAFSFVSGSGLSARHSSALLPLLLFALLDHTRARWRTALLAAVWITSILRLTTLPEYRKDDYRAAVGGAIEIAATKQADIIWAGDPLTAGYYGLRLANPLRLPVYGIDYTEAIRRVDWPIRARGLLGIGAEDAQAAEILRQARTRTGSAILGIPTRLPFAGLSAFWKRLPSTGDQLPWTRLIGDAQPAATYQLMGIYELR